MSNFRLSNSAVSGWTEEDSTYILGDTNSLCQAVDGACVTYAKFGADSFSREKMQNGGSNVSLLAMNFGAIQAAKNIFARMDSGGITLGIHSKDTVLCTSTNYYLTVYARMNTYYFELSFYINADNPSDSTSVAAALSSAEASANAFIERYQAIVK